MPTAVAAALSGPIVMSIANGNTTLLNECAHFIDKVVDSANDLCEDSEELGAEYTDQLAGKYEAALRIIIQAETKLKANKRSIEELSSTLPANVQVKELQATFVRNVEGRYAERAEGEELFTAHPKFAQLQKKLKRGGGDAAGGSGGDDEDVMMTQETMVNFNCPLSQVAMTAEGPHRPVSFSKCKTPRCIFSHKGVTEWLNSQKGKTAGCPIAGCSVMLRLNDLKERKDIVRKIKSAMQEELPSQSID